MRNLFLAVFIFTLSNSCSSRQTEITSETVESQPAVKQTVPGSMPAKDGSWTMTATINGKKWKATTLMPPETAGRIIGYYNKEWIGLPYNKSELVVGNKTHFGDDNAADLATNDETGLWGGLKGEMEIIKVDSDWAEGKFYFTASTKRSDKTMEVSDGFFRISYTIPK